MKEYTWSDIVKLKDIVINPTYGASTTRQKLKCVEINNVKVFGIEKIHIYYNKFKSVEDDGVVVCDFEGERGIVASHIMSVNERLVIGNGMLSEEYLFKWGA